MIRTPEESEAKIEELGFPAIFCKLARASDIDELLRSGAPLAIVGHCSPVRRYYELLPDLVGILPQCENYVPLWEWNGEEVTAYDERRDVFVEYRFGEFFDRVLATGYQKLVTHLFVQLVLSGVDEELDELAEEFEYRHLDALRTFSRLEDDSDLESDLHELLDSIPD